MMDDMSFVKCRCPVESNVPKPHQTPELFNLSLLAWLYLWSREVRPGLFLSWVLVEVEEEARSSRHEVYLRLFSEV